MGFTGIYKAFDDYFYFIGSICAYAGLGPVELFAYSFVFGSFWLIFAIV